MSNLRNSVHLLGHVGQAPEIRTLDNGKKMATLSLATNEYYTNSLGEKIQNTQWHNLVFWNRIAETVEEYVSKGSSIAVQGSINYRSWDDENGGKQYRTQIVVHDIVLLGKP